MNRIRLPANGWEPRDYQKKAWNAWHDGCNHLELIWHRRSGKDELALHGTAIKAMERPATYWHMLPVAAQARKAIWDAVNPHTGTRRIDEAFPHELRRNTREQDMMIRFKNGSTWQVIGSDNYENVIGSPPAGIVYSEWAQAKPTVRALLRPILVENGGWQFFITTPRGKNHAYKTFRSAQKSNQAFAQLLTANDTPVFSPSMLEYELNQLIDEYGRSMGEALFNQEYMCSFSAAVVGSYYGDKATELERAGRFCSVDHDPDHPVYVIADLGHTDDTVLIFYQIIMGEVRIIDYVSESNRDPDYYVSQMLGRNIHINIVRGKIIIETEGVIDDVAHRADYEIATVWLPHDGKAKTLAAKGKSVQEQFAEVFGWSKVKIVPSLSVQDGIQAARKLFNRLWIDIDCEYILETVRQYRREWDEKNRMFRDSPLHDWTSHVADAIRYLAIVWAEKPEPKSSAAPKKPVKGIESMTFNDMIRLQSIDKGRRRRR